MTATGGQAEVAWVTFASDTVVNVKLASTSHAAPATYTLSGMCVVASQPGAVTVSVTGTTTTDTEGQPTSVTTTYDAGRVIGVAMATKRLGGVDRYATAAMAYAETVGGCNNNNNVAVLARGDSFADAMTASYLAGQLHTGVLLTDPNTLPKATLDQLRVSGIYKVYVVGAAASVSQKVRDEIARTASYLCDPILTPVGDGIKVVNVPAGANRYATAAEVAGLLRSGRDRLGGDRRGRHRRGTAHRCAGQRRELPRRPGRRPDGLREQVPAAADAAGPPRCRRGRRHRLPGDPAGDHRGRAPVGVTAGRGRGRAPWESGWCGSPGPTGWRRRSLSPTSRSPATEVGTGRSIGLGFSPSSAVLTRGDSFPDALVMGPVAGSQRSPLLLTGDPATLGAATATHLANAGRGAHPVTPFGTSSATLGPIERLVVAGSPLSVADSTLRAALVAAASR